MPADLTIDSKDYFLNKIIAFFLFGLLVNGLNLPIDKVVIVTFIGFLLFVSLFQIKIHYLNLAILFSWFFLALFSSLYNFTFKPMIFFPVVGIFFVFVIVKVDWIHTFHKVLFLYILISFCFGIMAYIAGPNFTVTSLTSKGIPFLLPFKGLTTTVQTFGTICLLWIIINFEIGKRKFGVDFFIVLMSLTLTFNRSSYLFLFFVLAIYNRTFLWFSAVFFIALLTAFFEQITAFFFNMSSLQSREELLQGFYLSFWNDNTFIGYLLGKGNNYYAPEIVSQVKWDHRSDIENGYALLLHTYGFAGLFGYFICTSLLLFYSLIIQSYKLAIIMALYFFMTQYFTQEFVTNIFYLFTAAVWTLLNNKNEYSSS